MKELSKEEEELLFKDLSQRLPYKVKCNVYDRIGTLTGLNDYGAEIDYGNGEDTTCEIKYCKPYLRSLSSMTEEEILELYKIAYDTWYNDSLYYKSEEWISFRDSIRNNTLCFKSSIWASDIFKVYDWLNKNMFDYRGLIPMDLALKAPKNMYSYEV